VVPHGVDLDAYRRARPLDVRARYGLPPRAAVLVFHGVYRYPPNLDAVHTVAGEILPRLRAAGHDAWLLAIGADAPAHAPGDGVRFTGAVDDLPAHLLGADVAVVPLRHGAGTRMKVLEYFAARLPVVASPKAVEGLGITPGVHAWIEDDPEAFAGAVARLLDDRAAAERLGRRGRWSVEGRDWRVMTRRYLEIAAVLAPAATPSPTSPRSGGGSRRTAARTRPRPAAGSRRGRRDARTRPPRSAARGR
jgi:glycosyltransferase involved in cell wall biosynthesis